MSVRASAPPLAAQATAWCRRLELTVPGGAGIPPDELTRLLVASMRGGALVPIATLRTRRAGVRVRDLDGSVAEVVLDTVAVLEQGRVVRRFREIEGELLTGDEATLERIRQALRAAGAVDGDGRPKVFQALGNRTRIRDGPRRIVRCPRPRPSDAPGAGRLTARPRSGRTARYGPRGAAQDAGGGAPASGDPARDRADV